MRKISMEFPAPRRNKTIPADTTTRVGSSAGAAVLVADMVGMGRYLRVFVG